MPESLEFLILRKRAHLGPGQDLALYELDGQGVVRLRTYEPKSRWRAQVVMQEGMVDPSSGKVMFPGDGVAFLEALAASNARCDYFAYCDGTNGFGEVGLRIPLVLADGTRLVFRPDAGMPDYLKGSYLRECAAYGVDCAMGLGVVPPRAVWTPPMEVQEEMVGHYGERARGVGLLSWWQEIGEADLRVGEFTADERERVAALDYAIGNVGREPNSFATGVDGQVIAANQAMAFGAAFGPRGEVVSGQREEWERLLMEAGRVAGEGIGVAGASAGGAGRPGGGGGGNSDSGSDGGSR